MPGTKRNKALKAKHRELIADMRLRSRTLNQIASALQLSKATVKRELRKLVGEWHARASKSIETHRHLELARLELIEREAFSEWERSKQDYTKQVTEKVKGMGKGGEEFETEPKVVKRETGGRIGDPRLLEIAIRAQDARRKMLGLDAPTKVAPTDPAGQQAYQPEKMTDAELDARISELVAKSSHLA